VLSGVTNDGKQDQTDELFRDPTTTGQPTDRIDKPFGSNRDKDCDHNKKGDGHRQRQLRYFFVLLVLLSFSRTTPFFVDDSSQVIVGVGTNEMGVTVCRSLNRDTVLLCFLHRGESKEFLRLLLRARSSARGILDCLRFLTGLVIVQTLVRKELEDEVRNVNLDRKLVNRPLQSRGRDHR